ncbi:DUF4426 domain-containing protein [Pseudohalioglobus lutimaris]|uniref:DUF4426 domain-containing protein n=1 Tax=Pseudohalioglobus lutimaris TaxID=1737061 RepID=A0A2N5X936_9GAMM|nr:DUF4426 domain-containing protein [Pseudohalioglobus lutimaris]PLW70968.1 DUF4426 domain-containing protein [Pseudohalioglobus lutimaris]
MRIATLFLLLATLLPALPATAQLSEMFGPYELHYSVVNTTFIEPGVAATYGITRGTTRAILNLSVRERSGDIGSVPRTMQLQGTTWDLMRKTDELAFQEIREGPAIYYIAELDFLDEEWRHFEVHFRPEGAQQTYTFELKHQMYTDHNP